MVEESLQLWQRRRARADNISAIVVFLDDEFKTWADDDDNESVASSEADTIIASNGEDDTPPMSMGENSINTLVRQLALPYSGNHSESSESECSSSGSGVSSRKGSSQKCTTTGSSHQQSTAVEALPLSTASNCSSKRKIKEESNTVPPTKQRKKTRGASPPDVTSEESHQCNVITVLSTESLYGLQLDENLAADFVDESDESEIGSSDSSVAMPGSKNIEEHLNFMPVPQATK